VKRSSACDERMYFDRYVRESIGRLPVCDVRPSHVRGILDDAAAKGLKRATVAHVRGVMHRLFRAALEEELIEHNPVAAVRVPKMREVRVRRPAPRRRSPSPTSSPRSSARGGSGPANPRAGPCSPRAPATGPEAFGLRSATLTRGDSATRSSGPASGACLRSRCRPRSPACGRISASVPRAPSRPRTPPTPSTARPRRRSWSTFIHSVAHSPQRSRKPASTSSRPCTSPGTRAPSFTSATSCARRPCARSPTPPYRASR
jgi:hypothetical protein